MVSNVTIHCDCGTDVHTTTTAAPATCPDCEAAFALTVVELPENHDAFSTHNGSRSYRGP
ncbi:hypothetical protein C487_12306 [Natrinema pallidum DSM 3751]|uniref:Small CPxCG-related zinc finger protein n=3 Tax=Natrinema TaxID=88723 RepID=L9YRD0_9EURY|nr:hypothetical protein [Natrinema pallidum]ELY76246.1 hypothetical protein C487_12306 [Natrinema pallidum DSM 3751]QCW02831.1 hypothetical protein FGF80_06090 [Natrinema pallidum]